MSGSTIAIAPAQSKPKTVAIKRVPRPGTCPGCDSAVQVAGSSHKCGSCGLVAPPSAFTVRGGSSNAMDGISPNRAWTLGGRVD